MNVYSYLWAFGASTTLLALHSHDSGLVEWSFVAFEKRGAAGQFD